MDVDVVDRLASLIAGVDDRAISGCQAFGASDFSRRPVQVTEEFPVLLLCVRNGRYVPARDDEHVHGRLRFDVCEGITVLILVNRFGGNASVNDLAEKAAHGCFEVYRLMSLEGQ